MDIRNNKQRGEWAELRFMAKASEHGFKLNQPWGDLRYDVAIDLDGRLIRVQIKSTILSRLPGSFVVKLCRSAALYYQKSDFDVLALYVVAMDIWYIIPAAAALRWRTIQVAPGCEHNAFERFREAWHLMRDGVDTTSKKQPGISIHAMAAIDPCPPVIRGAGLLGDLQTTSD
jgi:PD-(D/E)XK endonuclease